jgi:site-specific DNA-cytosine methylase
MRKLVGASFYSGIGCADLGMLEGGVAELAWSCEYDEMTADWHEANFGKHILRSPTGSCLGVCDINPYQVERPNVLWLSPECKTFSLLNKDKRKRLGHGKPLEEAKRSPITCESGNLSLYL